MKYNQPYGVSDPNAAYVNGNPATGTMGSIPPAASIEYPQREITNFITDSGMLPDDGDLRQLGRSVQNGVVTYAMDTGSVNNVVLTPSPPLLGYTGGLFFRFKAKTTPQGASVCNISGLGNKRMRGRNGLDIRAADWLAGDIILMVYDGTDFQVLGTDAQPRLQAPRNYYVATNGDDNNDGQTAATPFLTLQKACNQIPLFNLNGFILTIYVANGTYNYPTSIALGAINGSGGVNFVGNPSQPANVVIRCASGSCFQIYGAWYSFEGFKFESLGPAIADPGKALSFAAGQGYAKNLVFGQCNDGCINASGTASVLLSGAFTIQQSTPCFVQGYVGGFCETNEVTSPALTVTPGITFNRAFAVSTMGSIVALHFSSITGTGCIGSRYLASMNGVIGSGGGGPSYFPGNAVGTVDTGGQYL